MANTNGKNNKTVALVLSLLIIALPLLLIVVHQQQQTRQEAAALPQLSQNIRQNIPALPSLPPGCSSSSTSCSKSCTNGKCTENCDRKVTCLTGTPEQQVDQLSTPASNNTTQQQCNSTSCSTNCVNGVCTETCSKENNCASITIAPPQQTQSTTNQQPQGTANTVNQQNVVNGTNCASTSVSCKAVCTNGVCTNNCDQELNCPAATQQTQIPSITPPVRRTGGNVWDYIVDLNTYWRNLIYPGK